MHVGIHDFVNIFKISGRESIVKVVPIPESLGKYYSTLHNPIFYT